MYNRRVPAVNFKHRGGITEAAHGVRVPSEVGGAAAFSQPIRATPAGPKYSTETLNYPYYL